MLWKMQGIALQSMGRTNHKFPIHVTGYVQTHLKRLHNYCHEDIIIIVVEPH